VGRKITFGTVLSWGGWLLFGIIILGGLAAAGYYVVSTRPSGSIAGENYAYQLQFEHGLSLGDAYPGEKEFVGRLEKAGFSLKRKMSIDDFEFESPGDVYLLRVKTAKGRITALYHYLNHGMPRPENRVNFLGDSENELAAALGKPTYIVQQPVLRYVYELADADLSVSFGKDGWVVETVLQLPIRRSETPPN
jgi:hypothetical protein